LYKIQLREAKLKSQINPEVIQFCNLCQYKAWQVGLINDIGGDASSMETETFTNHEYLYLFHTLPILYLCLCYALSIHHLYMCLYRLRNKSWNSYTPKIAIVHPYFNFIDNNNNVFWKSFTLWRL